ncbi:MAG TPA: hypothetical protein VHE34_22520 [Puia sp.]|uniref:hypothetical protein n=1 Tax=Puia sp. TaxID=2045100 RepID=UPI002B5CBA99|nr:hypothetical protein [Puia sp.]HVU98023.1 hypothetical protein [Puia sp.]
MNSKINALLTGAAILLALAGAKAQSSGQLPDNSSNYHIFDGKGQEILNTDWKGHIYTITRMGGVITGLCVDNKKIDSADRSKYASVVSRILKQVEIDEAQAERDRAQGELDRQQADRDRAHADRDRAQAEVERRQAARDREQAVHDQEQAVRDREQAARDREQAEADRRQAAEDRENFRRLTAFLVEKKLIPDAAGLKSLLLTDDELMINGKKADEAIHKELKEKFGRWAHQGLSVGDGCNCSASVHFHTGSNP